MEDKTIMVHAHRIQEYSNQICEVDNYSGPNPKRRRVYRWREEDKGVENVYGTLECE